jgi:hypothetical protein
VRLGPLGSWATVWPAVQPPMVDADERGAVGGMGIGRGNQSAALFSGE